MRTIKNLLPALFVCLGLTGISFSPKTPVPATGVQEHYSIDQLPESWKANSSLIRAINFILPNTVPELARSISCTDCEAPYSVALLIDSPITFSQKIEDIGNKRHSGGFNYQCVTKFTFKASLAVYDHNEHGIAKVLVVDPVLHDFTTKKKFNVYSKGGADKLSPEEFVSNHPSETGPSQQELIDLTEKRIYRLKEEVNKLIERN